MMACRRLRDCSLVRHWSIVDADRHDETERLAILDSYGILDTPAEQAFDDVVKLASQLLDAPIAAVNLIAKDRQWFKSEVGLGTREMPLGDSICKFALLEDQLMIVPDTREDARFACNPLVTGQPGLRFYAGQLLKTKAGIPLGTLCVLDVKPRPHGLTQQQQFVLATLAQQIMSQIELRKVVKDQALLIARQAQVQGELRESQRLALEVSRQAEAERRRTDALLEAAPVGIVIADANGAIVTMNAENRRMLGLHPDATDLGPGQPRRGWWADGSAQHGQLLAPHEWSLARALLGEETPRQVIEIAPFDAAGPRRTVLNSARPVRDETGAITGAVIAQMDITDRVDAESALRTADQKKDEFLAMLAHELRNPLAPIMSASAILSNFHFDEGVVRRTGAIIARQAAHMTSLINDLLDVSRVTRGKVELDTAELNIKDVIADAIEQVRPLVTRHQHHLDVLLAPVQVMVKGDRKRLVQVFANLLGNAAKYTPDGGRIELLLEAQARTLTISIRDNGIGMSAELIDSAFDLFSQGAQGLDRSQGGLGIGLALARSLVHLHGGAVSAKSDGAGMGCQLEVTLPRVGAAACSG
ncbi:sensor histidine kinase [Pseudoduganella lutea]|uniref:histidine kinase n=1 Tax=Pseudoduganella lutea TaxID=321985 RepID=A0A4P6KWA8_9BURK|nr:ATP-binding protein [Pseudoduganella lutea]QBE62752.1 PAS domain S-box protein [Pseudoduganella lutea]